MSDLTHDELAQTHALTVNPDTPVTGRGRGDTPFLKDDGTEHRLNTHLLINTIVQQTMVFIAQLATAGGVRAPLAKIAVRSSSAAL